MSDAPTAAPRHARGISAGLAFVAGFVDTCGFIALFGLFTAHVTGNFVVIGASLVQPRSGLVTKLLALPTFVLVVAFVHLLMAARSKAGKANAVFVLVTQALLLSLFLAAGVAALPIARGDDPLAMLAGAARRRGDGGAECGGAGSVQGFHADHGDDRQYDPIGDGRRRCHRRESSASDRPALRQDLARRARVRCGCRRRRARFRHRVILVSWGAGGDPAAAGARDGGTQRGGVIRRACLAALVLLAAGPAFAQEARPDFKLYRYDEDWRALCEPAARTQPLDAVKCLRLAEDTTLTVGGDLRARLEVASNPSFGLRFDDDHALLGRAMLHADLRIGGHVRAFVQLGAFDQTGRSGGSSPTDTDRGDLMQGFLDLSAGVAGGQATLRAGRQEIGLGSSRIVSVRDGPNIRRAFDGVRGFWTHGRYRVDALYLKPVVILPGSFDDRTSDGEHIAGLYATGPLAGGSAASVDLYWFDYRRDNARFASGIADERRQSVGARLFGHARGADWDVEGVYQWGRFGARGIAAWTVASNIGYTLAGLPGTPRLGLKADIASGDHSGGNGTLGTFNALYPKLPYFSEANLVAPANVVDLHPEISFQLAQAVKPYIGWNILWRETTRDAIYAPPLVAIAGTAGRGGRYIGNQAIAGLDWQATAHVGIAAQYVHFTPGQTIGDGGGHTVDYLVTSVGYRF